MSVSSSREAVITKGAYFDSIGYEPHSGLQWRAHNSKARFRIPCCGRRWGKTTFGAREMGHALFIPDSWYWIVGPDYSIGEKEFRIIRNDLRVKLKLPQKEVKIVNNPKQGDMRIEMPWNTVLEVKSAKLKDSLLGEGLDGVIMSEAATHDMATWQQYIEPALSDKRGWAIFPSTPRGYNWFHGLWKMGQVNEEPDYESWRFPSWTNPIAYPGGRNDPEIKRIERNSSDMYFSQEYGANFTSFVGKIYEEWNPSIHVKRIDYNPAWENFWAFDFGWSNPFVCLDIMIDPQENIYVWREYSVTYKSPWEHAHSLIGRNNPDGFHVNGRYGDPRAAESIATMELVIGHIIANPVPWIQGVEAVKRWMKLQPDGTTKLFIDPSCTNLIRQIEGLRAPDESKHEKNPKEGQHDYDDHGPDALRYFFSEYFVLGSGVHLSDVYSPGQLGSESETFFRLNTGFTLTDEPIGYEW